MGKDRELIIAAADLARSSPRSWEAFLQAMQDYTDEKRDQCISSPVEALQVSQGRAQNSRDLLRLFTDCLKTSEQIKQKSEKRL